MGRLAEVHRARRVLPPGRGGLPRPVVDAEHRRRLLRAVIAVASEKGYAELTVADVVAAARVSRKAFYAQFADKQDCFVTATDEACALLFGRVEAAARAAPATADAESRLR